MKEINLADVLTSQRKAKGITQDDLANYIGVSKAAVSKWETGQCYPDVTFLPLLASYFNISIDELIDYQPQMSKEEIRKLYRRLAEDFTKSPFESVMEDCRKAIRKYYSCFPLLNQMGILIINHIELVSDPKQAADLVLEAMALFRRVKEESEDLQLKKQALFLEAYTCLAAQNPAAAVELLEQSIEAAMPPESILASAYQMTGRMQDAKAVLQIGIYQNIVVLFNFFPSYLMLCADDPSMFEEVLSRALAVAKTFDMKRLHPGVLVALYLAAAQGYLIQNQKERALEMLQEYMQVATGDIFPLRLHGDAYFTLLESWLSRLDLGNDLPRSDKTIRKSMVDVVAHHPAFAVLSQDPRFRSIVETLQHNSLLVE